MSDTEPLKPVRTGDIFARDIYTIDPDPDNTRDVTSEIARADIEEIAAAMVARGFDAGREILIRAKPGGRWMVTDGHKRRLAFLRAIELGASMRLIPTRSEPKIFTEEDRAIIRLRTPGRELSPVEAIVDIRRLFGWNWTPEAICERLGKKKDWLKRGMDLAGAPFEI